MCVAGCAVVGLYAAYSVCGTECGEHDVVKQRYFPIHCKFIGERESPTRGERKSITLLEGSLASPARPSGRGSIKVKMNEERKL